MRIAFYAPMKPPDSSIPSGDREIARILIRALDNLGCDVFLASRLRTWQKAPDEGRFTDIVGKTAREKDRLLAGLEDPEKRPDVWLTYHNYYKAPDVLGPEMADALGIPYMLVEASRSAKRRDGPWAASFAASERALKRADLVASLHSRDEEGIATVVPEGHRMRLPPFIDTAPFRRGDAELSQNSPPRLLTVAMMRPGDKVASYRVLAEALKAVEDLDWHLTIVGDGAARGEIVSLFEGPRYTFKGSLAKDRVAECCKASDVFVWPAINEAFGMVFIEAQAASLAVIAGASLGVPDVVANGRTGLLVPPGDVSAFSDALRQLLTDSDLCQALRQNAGPYAEGEHSLTIGRERLDACIKAAIANFKTTRASGGRRIQ